MHAAYNSCVDVCECLQFCVDDFVDEASMNSNVNWNYKMAMLLQAEADVEPVPADPVKPGNVDVKQD